MNIIKCSVEYKVKIDHGAIVNVFGNMSPFNLEKDLKCYDDVFLKLMSEEIGALLKKGPRGKTYVEISCRYFNNAKITYSKFRIADSENCKGKSGGLRCIAIVDNLNHWCIILHVFEKNKEENIDKKSENKVKKMLNKYTDSL